VDEAACSSFCLSAVDEEEDAPWRLRTTVKTLRMNESVGAFQVQTLAPDPTKLEVDRRSFDHLRPRDQQMLLDRGLVQRKVSVCAGSARITFVHVEPPKGRAVKKDVDLGLQLAACQQAEKEAKAALNSLKLMIHSQWAENTKVEVQGEGYVRLGVRTSSHQTVKYSCVGGEEAFKRLLSADEQKRLKHVFARPENFLHVRGVKASRTVNTSGRALTVSTGGVSVAGGGGAEEGEAAPRLPTHSFASRRRQR